MPRPRNTAAKQPEPKPYPTLEEQIYQIVRECAEGKRKSQEALFKMFAPKMFGVSILYTKDYSEAEDVLQESFVKVFGRIKQFKFEGSFEGWVRKVVVNTALEKHRRKTRLYPVHSVEDYVEEHSYQDIASVMDAADLMKLVHELSPQYRVVFSLYAIEGYSHKEIADMLNISEGTSKSNLSRARKILQDKVREHYHVSEQRGVV